MSVRLVRYRWPHSLDAILAAAVIEQCSRERGIGVRCIGTKTLIGEADEEQADELYLLDYGCMLSVPYLVHCCHRYAMVHVYDHHAGERQVPVRDNLSIHNVMDVSTCALVARDFGFHLDATQQSLFAYVEDALVLHTRALPLEAEFRRGAEVWLHGETAQDALALEPAALMERGRQALQADALLAERLVAQALPFGRPVCGRLAEIRDASQHSALASLVTALLYRDRDPVHSLPLLVALWMGRNSLPYVLLRTLPDTEAEERMWSALHLERGVTTMECGEWERIKRQFICQCTPDGDRPAPSAGWRSAPNSKQSLHIVHTRDPPR